MMKHSILILIACWNIRKINNKKGIAFYDLD